jgi:RimJ/RimL family protein N-acetyltransferase
MRLVVGDERLLAAAVQGDDALAEAIGCPVAPGWVSFEDALRLVLDGVSADPASVAWGPRIFVATTPPTVVGWGGFKGPPDGGAVEIGYEIAPSLRNRGLATAAAAAMVDEAFADPSVTAVIAHTLAEPNASTRVLTKLGFRHEAGRAEGDVETWRFRLDRPPA